MARKASRSPHAAQPAANPATGAPKPQPARSDAHERRARQMAARNRQATSSGPTSGWAWARIWLLAARPKTLPAAFAPVFVGTTLAIRDETFLFWPALAAMFCALLLQIGANFANDYFDHRKGADTPDRQGPIRITAAGIVTPDQMRNATAIVLGIATLLGVYLVFVGGWPILAVGVAALLAALTYTGGPFPYGYAGLGDVFVFIFFGLVAVNGTYFLQSGAISDLSILIGICMGALATAILVVNNIRDIETDRRAGKRTLAVILGPRAMQIEYMALMLIAYLGAILLWQMAGGSIYLLLPLISMPLALRHIQEIWGGTRGRRLNDTLAGTARVGLFYSLLLSAGLLL